MKVGFIGVGNIGAPIAGQLLKAGHSLVVNDLKTRAVSCERGNSLAAEFFIVASNKMILEIQGS